MKTLYRDFKVKMYGINTHTKLKKEECGTPGAIWPNRPFGYELETQITYRGTRESLHQHRSEASSQRKGPFCFDWLNVQIWLWLQDVIRTRSKRPTSQNALFHSYTDPVQSSAGSHLSSFTLKSATEAWARLSKLVPDEPVRFEKFPVKSKVNPDTVVKSLLAWPLEFCGRRTAGPAEVQ